MANSNLINKARALLANITPGKWSVISQHGSPDVVAEISHKFGPPEMRRIVKALHHMGSEDRDPAHNAAFIAAAPELVTALVKELETERSAFDILAAQYEKLRRDLSELEQRNREKSGPIVDVLNILAVGDHPTTDQIRAAREAYKWAIYGVAISAQIVSAATEADKSGSA